MTKRRNKRKIQDLKQSNKIENIPNNQPVTQIQQSVQSWSGPIPSPEDFRRFKEVDSTFPDRILKMAENEQKIYSQKIYSKHLFADKRLEGLTLVAVSAIFMGFLGAIPGLSLIICETLAAIVAIATKKQKYRASMQ